MAMTCRCGSSLLVKNGQQIFGGYVKQRYTCQACHRSQFANITAITNTLDSLDSRMSLRDVTRTWRSNGSTQMVIPKEIAIHAGIAEGCMVAVESTEQGILIKKLEVPAC